VNKSDRNDARGIAQMMRVGLYKPVHVKTLVSQHERMLLTSRKLLRDKLHDVENELRGTLRNFGLRIGVVSTGHFCALQDGRGAFRLGTTSPATRTMTGGFRRAETP